jgi:hypothetical protein
MRREKSVMFSYVQLCSFSSVILIPLQMSDGPLILSNIPNALFAIASVTQGEISWLSKFAPMNITPEEDKTGNRIFARGYV